MILQQEIGLQSPILLGLGTLGNKVIIVALTSLRNFPSLKKDRIALTTSSWIMGQVFLQKYAENPSGPGDLPKKNWRF